MYAQSLRITRRYYIDQLADQEELRIVTFFDNMCKIKKI